MTETIIEAGAFASKYRYQMIPKILTTTIGGGIITVNGINGKIKESRLEVQTFLAKLKYALESGSSEIKFQEKRKVDEGRNKRFTNRFTTGDLFPDEDEIEALKRELASLSVDEYTETVKDLRYPKQSEMRVFGKRYNDNDVYIKIRVELVSASKTGRNNYIFVMSFHYSERNFDNSDFLYRGGGG